MSRVAQRGVRKSGSIKMQLVITAFRVNVHKPELNDQLPFYMLEDESYLGYVRAELAREGIPHIVYEDEGILGIVTPVHLDNPKDYMLRMRRSVRASRFIGGLVRIAARVALLKQGWKSASIKVYNPQVSESDVPLEFLRKHPAVILGSSTRYDAVLLHVDACYKLEFSRNLDEILRLVERRRTLEPRGWLKGKRVKIYGHHYSFIVHDVIDPDKLKNYIGYDYEDIAERLEKALVAAGVYPQSVNWLKKSRGKYILLAEPMSRRVVTALRRYNLILKNKKQHTTLRVAPVPSNIATLVPSIENIKVLSHLLDVEEDKVRRFVDNLRITPNDRVDKIEQLVQQTITYGLDEVVGVKFSIDREMYTPRDYIRVRRLPGGLDVATFVEKTAGPWFRRLEGKPLSNVNVALAVCKAKDERLTSILVKIAKSMINFLKKLGADVDANLVDKPLAYPECIIQLSGIEADIRAALATDHGIDYTRFKLDAAKHKIYPLFVKKETLLEIEEGRLRPLTIGYSRTKTLLLVAGIWPLKAWLDYIDSIKAVDATLVESFRLALPVVVAKPKKYIEDYMLVEIEAKVHQVTLEKDEDTALTNAILHTNIAENTLILLNRTRIPDKLLESKLRAIITATKTHNQGRILRKTTDKTTYYNPLLGDTVKLEEYRKEDWIITRYLTSLVGYGTKREVADLAGTVKPTLITIATRSAYETQELLEFTIALALVGRASIHYTPSLPYPLRLADKLAKMINKIYARTHGLPLNVDLRYLLV